MVSKVSDLQTPKQKRKAKEIYPRVAVMKYVTAGGLRKAFFIIFYMISLLFSFCFLTKG